MRKTGLLPILILAGLVIVGALILKERNSDVVTTHFSTVQEARSKGALDRGWLPPVLPESARDITETNHLDSDSGNGSFTFNAADFAAFASHLKPASPELAKRDWKSRVSGGFSIFTLSRDGTEWTLVLHPDGRGLYTVGPSR